MPVRSNVPGKEHVNRDLDLKFTEVRDGDTVHEARRDLLIDQFA
jgi:hypothetical protein